MDAGICVRAAAFGRFISKACLWRNKIYVRHWLKTNQTTCVNLPPTGLASVLIKLLWAPLQNALFFLSLFFSFLARQLVWESTHLLTFLALLSLIVNECSCELNPCMCAPISLSNLACYAIRQVLFIFFSLSKSVPLQFALYFEVHGCLCVTLAEQSWALKAEYTSATLGLKEFVCDFSWTELGFEGKVKSAQLCTSS